MSLFGFNEVVVESPKKFEQYLVWYCIHGFRSMDVETLWAARINLQFRQSYPKSPEQLLEERNEHLKV